jgi:hypothetical protein
MQLEDFMEFIEAGEIPPEPPDGLTGAGSEWNSPLDNNYSYGDYLRARTACIEKGMWALVKQQSGTARMCGYRRRSSRFKVQSSRHGSAAWLQPKITMPARHGWIKRFCYSPPLAFSL